MINLYKRVGETPKEALDRLRIARPDLSGERLSYAGRLDPLAEGVLPVMVGEDNDKRDEYLYLPKVYEADIVFGIDTDTHDPLGLVKEMKPFPVDEEGVKKLLPKFTGAFSQEYPAFSSRTVGGEPLFMKARRGEVVVLPTHEVFVKKLEAIKFFEVEAEDLWKKAKEQIHSVHGDFRQKEIEEVWFRHVSKFYTQKFYGVTIILESSSGFYVRALARDLGRLIGTNAIATRIVRKKVGIMSVEESIFP